MARSHRRLFLRAAQKQVSSFFDLIDTALHRFCIPRDASLLVAIDPLGNRISVYWFILITACMIFHLFLWRLSLYVHAYPPMMLATFVSLLRIILLSNCQMHWNADKVARDGGANAAVRGHGSRSLSAHNSSSKGSNGFSLNANHCYSRSSSNSYHHHYHHLSVHSGATDNTYSNTSSHASSDDRPSESYRRQYCDLVWLFSFIFENDLGPMHYLINFNSHNMSPPDRLDISAEAMHFGGGASSACAGSNHANNHHLAGVGDGSVRYYSLWGGIGGGTNTSKCSSSAISYHSSNNNSNSYSNGNGVCSSSSGPGVLFASRAARLCKQYCAAYSYSAFAREQVVWFSLFAVCMDGLVMERLNLLLFMSNNCRWLGFSPVISISLTLVRFIPAMMQLPTMIIPSMLLSLSLQRTWLRSFYACYSLSLSWMLFLTESEVSPEIRSKAMDWIYGLPHVLLVSFRSYPRVCALLSVLSRAREGMSSFFNYHLLTGIMLWWTFLLLESRSELSIASMSLFAFTLMTLLSNKWGRSVCRAVRETMVHTVLYLIFIWTLYRSITPIAFEMLSHSLQSAGCVLYIMSYNTSGSKSGVLHVCIWVGMLILSVYYMAEYWTVNITRLRPELGGCTKGGWVSSCATMVQAVEELPDMINVSPRVFALASLRISQNMRIFFYLNNFSIGLMYFTLTSFDGILKVFGHGIEDHMCLPGVLSRLFDRSRAHVPFFASAGTQSIGSSPSPHTEILHRLGLRSWLWPSMHLLCSPFGVTLFSPIAVSSSSATVSTNNSTSMTRGSKKQKQHSSSGPSVTVGTAILPNKVQPGRSGMWKSHDSGVRAGLDRARATTQSHVICTSKTNHPSHTQHHHNATTNNCAGATCTADAMASSTNNESSQSSCDGNMAEESSNNSSSMDKTNAVLLPAQGEADDGCVADLASMRAAGSSVSGARPLWLRLAAKFVPHALQRRTAAAAVARSDRQNLSDVDEPTTANVHVLHNMEDTADNESSVSEVDTVTGDGSSSGGSNSEETEGVEDVEEDEGDDENDAAGGRLEMTNDTADIIFLAHIHNATDNSDAQEPDMEGSGRERCVKVSGNGGTPGRELWTTATTTAQSENTTYAPIRRNGEQERYTARAEQPRGKMPEANDSQPHGGVLVVGDAEPRTEVQECDRQIALPMAEKLTRKTRRQDGNKSTHTYPKNSDDSYSNQNNDSDDNFGASSSNSKNNITSCVHNNHGTTLMDSVWTGGSKNDKHTAKSQPGDTLAQHQKKTESNTSQVAASPSEHEDASRDKLDSSTEKRTDTNAHHNSANTNANTSATTTMTVSPTCEDKTRKDAADTRDENVVGPTTQDGSHTTSAEVQRRTLPKPGVKTNQQRSSLPPTASSHTANKLPRQADSKASDQDTLHLPAASVGRQPAIAADNAIQRSLSCAEGRVAEQLREERRRRSENGPQNTQQRTTPSPPTRTIAVRAAESAEHVGVAVDAGGAVKKPSTEQPLPASSHAASRELPITSKSTVTEPTCRHTVAKKEKNVRREVEVHPRKQQTNALIPDARSTTKTNYTLRSQPQAQSRQARSTQQASRMEEKPTVPPPPPQQQSQRVRAPPIQASQASRSTDSQALLLPTYHGSRSEAAQMVKQPRSLTGAETYVPDSSATLSHARHPTNTHTPNNIDSSPISVHDTRQDNNSNSSYSPAYGDGRIGRKPQVMVPVDENVIASREMENDKVPNSADSMTAARTPETSQRVAHMDNTLIPARVLLVPVPPVQQQQPSHPQQTSSLTSSPSSSRVTASMTAQQSSLVRESKVGSLTAVYNNGDNMHRESFVFPTLLNSGMSDLFVRAIADPEDEVEYESLTSLLLKTNINSTTNELHRAKSSRVASSTSSEIPEVARSALRNFCHLFTEHPTAENEQQKHEAQHDPRHEQRMQTDSRAASHDVETCGSERTASALHDGLLHPTCLADLLYTRGETTHNESSAVLRVVSTSVPSTILPSPAQDTETVALMRSPSRSLSHYNPLLQPSTHQKCHPNIGALNTPVMNRVGQDSTHVALHANAQSRQSTRATSGISVDVGNASAMSHRHSMDGSDFMREVHPYSVAPSAEPQHSSPAIPSTNSNNNNNSNSNTNSNRNNKSNNDTMEDASATIHTTATSEFVPHNRSPEMYVGPFDAPATQQQQHQQHHQQKYVMYMNSLAQAYAPNRSEMFLPSPIPPASVHTQVMTPPLIAATMLTRTTALQQGGQAFAPQPHCLPVTVIPTEANMRYAETHTPAPSLRHQQAMVHHHPQQMPVYIYDGEQRLIQPAMQQPHPSLPIHAHQQQTQQQNQDIILVATSDMSGNQYPMYIVQPNQAYLNQQRMNQQ